MFEKPRLLSGLRPGSIGLLVLVLATLVLSQQARASHQDFWLTTTGDTIDVSPGDGECADAQGRCSLRAAVMEANAHAGPDRIRFDFVDLGSRTFQLGITTGVESYPFARTGDLEVIDDLEIVGDGPSLAIIDARGIDRAFFVSNEALLVLRDLTVTGGLTAGNGGAIGVDTGAELEIDGVVLRGNAATNGGGVAVGGIARILRSEVHDNTATGRGGGIYTAGSVEINETAVHTNSAGEGGGIAIADAAPQDTVLRSSAVYGNAAASHGGGVYVSGLAVLVATTVSGNDATGAAAAGGGIYVAVVPTSSVLVLGSTVGSNSAGTGGHGIHAAGGSALLQFSIVADSAVDCDGPGSFGSGGFNLVETPAASCSALGPGGGNVYGVDPKLLPLERNGGRTPVHRLAYTSPADHSPAIDFGPAGSSCSATVSGVPENEVDQRGVLRLTETDGDGDGFGACDIGAYEAGFLVTSTGDEPDMAAGDGICASGAGTCTLRAAIEEANVLGGKQAIAFGIAGAGPHTVAPALALPDIAGPVIIDGYTQPGASVNSAAWGAGSNATILVEIDGSTVGGAAAGLRLGAGSSGSTIRGLAISGFGDGITTCNVVVAGGTDHRITGNFIGMDAGGTTPVGGACGIAMTGGGAIGTPDPADRNVVSGHTGFGIRVNAAAAGVLLQNNLVGTDRTGSVDAGNGGDGLIVLGQNVAAGGFESGSGNVIGGNGGNGLYAASTSRVLVLSNFIGVRADGSAGPGNDGDGVHLSDTGSSRIGSILGGNTISGNGGSGIVLLEPAGAADLNVIQSNRVGLGATGTAPPAIANGVHGIWVGPGVTGTNILNNTIGASGENGILLQGDDTNIRNNFIGVAPDGVSDRGNAGDGIHINSSNNVVESQGAFPSGNLISGNDGYGVYLDGGANNTVRSNRVGTNAAGTAPIANGLGGIRLANSPGSTIGGATVVLPGGPCAGSCNLVSGNGGNGIELIGAGPLQVRGNVIGTDVTGTFAVGNASDGIRVSTAAALAIVGNLISGNGNGIQEVVSGVSQLAVRGNFIGTNSAGVAAIPNSAAGIHITNGSGGQVGGPGAGDRNVISGNAGPGVSITGVSGVHVEGNFIGLGADGATGVANSVGVRLTNGANNSVVTGNAIAFNTGPGVEVAEGVQASTGNSIPGNRVFNNGGLGIDLRGDGLVEGEDAGDADSWQNAPRLALDPPEGTAPIAGTLLTTVIPGVSIAIELFTSQGCDVSGSGEGETLLATAGLLTDGTGTLAFAITLPRPSAAGEVLTATATGPAGTSEFSACVTVGGATATSVSIDGLVTSTPELAPGATFVPLDRMPATAIHDLPAALAGAPITSIGDLASSPITSIPITSIPITSITTIAGTPITSIPITSIPITSIGGWAALLEGTELARQPLQSVTLGEVLATGRLEGLTLAEVNLLATTELRQLSLGALLLGAVPCEDLELDCGSAETAIEAEILGAGLDAAGVSSIPITSITTLTSVPITNIPITSIPITSIPITSIPITSIPITSIPITSINPALAAVPITSIGGPPGSEFATMCDYLAANGLSCGTLVSLADLLQSPVFTNANNQETFAAVPITSINLGAVDIGAIDLGTVPITSIGYEDGLETAPITSIPITSITLTGTDLGGRSLASVPITSIPITSISLEDVIGTAPITSIPITSIPITSIPITSIDMAAAPITSIPIASIPITSIGAYSSYCGAGDFVEMVTSQSDACELLGIDPQRASLRQLQLALAGAGYPGALSALTLSELLEALQATQPAETYAAYLQQTSLSAINVESIPITSIPITSTPITSIPITSIPITSIPITSIASLDGCAGCTTLGDIDAAGAWLPGATLGDLVDALAAGGYDAEITLGLFYGARLLSDVDPGRLTLGDLFAGDPSLFAGTTLAELIAQAGLQEEELRYFLAFLMGGPTIGDLYAEGGDLGSLTLGQLLIGLLERADYAWEDLDFDRFEVQRLNDEPAGTSPTASYEMAFTVSGGTAGFITYVTLDLPPDFLFAGEPAIAPPGPALGAVQLSPAPSGRQCAEIAITGLANDQGYTLTFQAYSSLSIGVGTVGAMVTVGDTSDSMEGAAVTVVDQWEDPQDPANNNVAGLNSPLIASDGVLLSHISSAEDADIYQVQAGPAGTRIAVFMGHLGTDADIVMYRAEQPDLVSTGLEPREIPLGSVPEGDNGDQSFVVGEDLEPEALTDIPLEELPIVAASTHRGTEDEGIEVISTEVNQTFYLKVSGYNGQFSVDPYVLRVKIVTPIEAPICEPRLLPPGTSVATSVTPGIAAARSIVLVNQERMQRAYGAAAVGDLASPAPGTLMARLRAFEVAGHGTIVPVDEAVTAGNRIAWDTNPCDPVAANAVAGDIIALVEQWRAANGAAPLLHVVIVGGDEIIPFVRLRDLTRLSNERDYAQTLGDVRGAIYGALFTGHILSDDPYGDAAPIAWLDRYLYVPDAAVGRLVETPAEIAAQIDQFLANDGALLPETAFVTGYDFLTDGAGRVKDALEAQGWSTSSSYITPGTGWSKDHLTGQFFEAIDPADIASINAHFDHWRLLPDQPNLDANLLTTGDAGVAPDAALPPPALDRRLLFSMGCHAGLSVADTAFATNLDPRTQDWAQVLAQRGVAVWIGNTGFGYGDRGTVALSERLMALLAQRLDGSLTAGQSLMAAKQEYFATLGLYGVYDEKALQGAVFYGLPMWQLSAVLADPEEIPQLPIPASDGGIGGSVTSQDVQIEVSTLATPVAGYGTLWEVAAATYTSGTTFSGTVEETGTQATQWRPLQPRISFDVTQPAQKAHGALITSLVMEADAPADPVFHRPLVDGSLDEPEMGFSAASFPSRFQSITSYTAVDRLIGPEAGFDEIRQNLVLIPGQFFFEGSAGMQRVFSEIGARVYYAPNGEQDWVQPALVRVDAEVVDTGSGPVVSFTVDATDRDEAGAETAVKRVYVLYRPSEATALTWLSLDLVNQAGTTRWIGFAPVPAGTTEVEYYIQAVDEVGNVGVTSNKATYFRAEVEETPPPPANVNIQLTGSGATVFDGFYVGPAVGVEITSIPPNLGLSFECSVDGSPFGPCPETVSGEGLHELVARASDGGVASISIPIKVPPGAAPSIDVTSPAGTYAVGQAAWVDYSCTPHGTGVTIVSCLGPVAPGGRLDTLTAGLITFEVTARDNAGRESVLSVQYTVADACDIPPTIAGSAKSETILGTPGDDVIHGNGGNDHIDGQGGNDIICGGNGNDHIATGDGNDVIVAGRGNDHVEAGHGINYVDAGSGNDHVATGDGEDHLLGGDGNDQLLAGGGTNTADGGPGNDVIVTGPGGDSLSGGAGADECQPGGGPDEFEGCELIL